VPERCVDVASGATSRRKRVVIATDDPGVLVARIGGLLDR
jgi:uncharacterized protein YggU (UPF0235/DUF167 family)